MKVFEIDDGSIYLIAATSIRAAIHLYWKFKDALDRTDVNGHLAVYELVEERARHILVDNSGTLETAWGIALREGPCVIGNDKWP